MNIKAIKTRIFEEKENLLDFIIEHLQIIEEETILVITSKIVALSQARTAIVNNDLEKEELIKKESDWALKTKYTWLTLKDGMLLKSAGLDQSNANGKLILLPENSFKVAKYLRRELKKKFKVHHLGIIIVDSRSAFLKKGSLGFAMAYAGFKGLKSYIGKKDIFGRKMKSSQVNIADSLAVSANLLMGEGAERKPLVLINDLKLEFIDKTNDNELLYDVKEDFYGDFFRNC